MAQMSYKAKSRQASSPASDNCQSPPYAILPILEYLGLDWTILEPAQGKGYMSSALMAQGWKVIAGDELTGQDFLTYDWTGFDCIITNPPNSKRIPFTARCFEIGKPFALLMGTEVQSAQKIQKLNIKYGDFEHVYPAQRINYKMPLAGWEGAGAHFNTHWFTWGLEIGQPHTYLKDILKAKKLFHEQVQDFIPAQK